MHILIHRYEMKDMYEVYNEIRDELLAHAPDNIMYSYVGGFIKSYDGELCIDFRSGKESSVIGTRPDYYNADSRIILEYMELHKSKEIDLDAICAIAIGILKKGDSL